MTKERKETIAAAALAIITVIFICVMIFYVGDWFDQWVPE